ncbi:Hypothetical protein NTJ_13288 [Nesidiocoris tenuis]|uniref:Uncharacterized protein n=1 Tax=Nesidiocoris tenuis TaxID=355587 RepID=A0ABN7BBH1_9HEMI|nr:Hypothetical protein NTJ_13288 [Nesidiocoris tenuis]
MQGPPGYQLRTQVDRFAGHPDFAKNSNNGGSLGTAFTHASNKVNERSGAKRHNGPACQAQDPTTWHRR